MHTCLPQETNIILLPLLCARETCFLLMQHQKVGTHVKIILYWHLMKCYSNIGDCQYQYIIFLLIICLTYEQQNFCELPLRKTCHIQSGQDELHFFELILKWTSENQSCFSVTKDGWSLEISLYLYIYLLLILL